MCLFLSLYAGSNTAGLPDAQLLLQAQQTLVTQGLQLSGLATALRVSTGAAQPQSPGGGSQAVAGGLPQMPDVELLPSPQSHYQPGKHFSCHSSIS